MANQQWHPSLCPHFVLIHFHTFLCSFSWCDLMMTQLSWLCNFALPMIVASRNNQNMDVLLVMGSGGNGLNGIEVVSGQKSEREKW
jgi:hypothetical protein